MRTVLSTLSLLALGIWLGAIVFFVMVAAVTFGALPGLFPNPAAGVHAAGVVVGGSLIRLNFLGIILGVLFIIFAVALNRLVHWHSVIPQLLLVIVMLVITCYSQFSIIPRMDTARMAAGGEIAAVSPDNPARQIFDHLHQLSTHLEAIVLVCGIIAFLLAGRTPIERVRVVRTAPVGTVGNRPA